MCAGIVFTQEPVDSVVCGLEVATFQCQFEGSTSLPTWIINSMPYKSLRSQLPPDHSYHDHTLYVANVRLDQNNTPYQCQLLLLANGNVCARRSSVGRLIINCQGIL